MRVWRLFLNRDVQVQQQTTFIFLSFIQQQRLSLHLLPFYPLATSVASWPETDIANDYDQLCRRTRGGKIWIRSPLMKKNDLRRNCEGNSFKMSPSYGTGWRSKVEKRSRISSLFTTGLCALFYRLIKYHIFYPSSPSSSSTFSVFTFPPQLYSRN